MKEITTPGEALASYERTVLDIDFEGMAERWQLKCAFLAGMTAGLDIAASERNRRGPQLSETLELIKSLRPIKR